MALKGGDIKPEDIQSWPIRGLTFVRIYGILRSFELVQQRDQSTQPQVDSNQRPKRLNLMEDALTGLNSQRACVAYGIIGSKTGVNYYMGMSLPAPPDGVEIDDDLEQSCYQIQRSILHSVFKDVDIQNKAYPSCEVLAMIAPIASNVGIVTGVASIQNTGKEEFRSEQIERIVNGLQGLDFGLLILAAPILPKMISEEEFYTCDGLHKAPNNQRDENITRMKYYFDLQDAYLKQLQLGASNEHWLVGFYFFANRSDVFVRLMSLIKAAYTDEDSRPTPFRLHKFEGLKEHLLKFGLLSNARKSAQSHNLFRYRFLSPLNSRMLSAYVNLPNSGQAGF